MRSQARERGQVVVLFAVLLPIFFLLGSVVLSVGNWYVHKRHLQTQVDAAALATGQDFVGCFLQPGTTNGLVKDSALKYAGDTQRNAAAKFDPLYKTANLQVQQPDDVRAVLNSADYWSTANAGQDPTTGYTLDWTMDGDPKTAGQQSSQPCDARFLDVKATDDKLPLLWRWIPLFPSVKAHAVVEIHELPGLSGFLPWAVPEAAPRTVAALFVDQDAAENQGVPIRVVPLAPDPDPNDPSVTTKVNGEDVSLWTGPALGVSAPVNVTDSTGMIIFTSRQVLTQAQLDGRRIDDLCSLNATACYGAVKKQQTLISTNKTGIGFVHGRPQSDGTGNKTATVTDVELTIAPYSNGKPTGGSACTDSTAPYYIWSQTDCDVRIRAQLDFGAGINDKPREVRVGTAPFGNKCNSGIVLDKETDSVTGLIWWEQEQNWTTITAGSGQNNFYLCWNAQSGANKAESGTFGDRVQQMAFAANTNAKSGGVFSGPVVSASIQQGHSVSKGPQTLSVSVGLIPPLRVSDGNAKPIFLRIAGPGSLNQALQCDKQLQLDDMVKDGCKTPYQVNKRDLVCDPYTINNLPPNLPPPDPDPWPDCIQAKTGQVAEMSKGIHKRWEIPPPPKQPCPENLWRKYRTSNPQELPPNTDPRFITLVVAEYGTFDDEGNKVLPITKFAGFYVTGWFTMPGQQMAQGCDTGPYPNDPPPSCPSFPNPNPNDPLCDPGATRYQGAVWGYFIKQVFPSPQRPGTDLCVFNQLGVCSADLVK